MKLRFNQGKFYRYWMVCCCVLFAHTALAQVRKDAGLWTSYALELKYKKKWKFTVTPEVRCDNNLTSISRVMSDFGAEYKPNKIFSGEISYRISTRRKDDWLGTRERLQLGAGVRKEWKSFTFAYQSKYQWALRALGSDGDADFQTTLRNKVSVKYAHSKKVDMSTSFEVFNNTQPGMEFAWEDWRWKADVGYKINKRNSVEVGYMIQKSIYDSPQEMDFVILLAYTFDLNLSKKKSAEKVKETPTQQ